MYGGSTQPEPYINPKSSLSAQTWAELNSGIERHGEDDVPATWRICKRISSISQGPLRGVGGRGLGGLNTYIQGLNKVYLRKYSPLPPPRYPPMGPYEYC